MSESIENYAFENFPRQRLPENIAQGELLSAILSRMAIKMRQSRDKKSGTWLA